MDKNKEIKVKDIEKHLDKTLIFKNDADFLYIYKKTEKIASAVYLITNLFPASEPLRWTLRESVLELLKDTLRLSGATSNESERMLREMHAGIFKTVSLFEIAHRAGFVSTMNFSILKEEFYSLIGVLQARDKSQVHVETVALDSSFFYVERPQSTAPAVPVIPRVERVERPIERPKPIVKQETQGVLYKGHAKGHDVLNKIEELHTQYLAQTQAQSSVDQDSSVAAPIPSPVSISMPSRSLSTEDKSDKTDDRQQTIVNYLKVHHEISIKDLTRVIQGCSEKTIQRDLGTLITQGIIKKVGERRWSKYYLV